MQESKYNNYGTNHLILSSISACLVVYVINGSPTWKCSVVVLLYYYARFSEVEGHCVGAQTLVELFRGERIMCVFCSSIAWWCGRETM